MRGYLSVIFALFLLTACSSRKDPSVTPWGTTVGENPTDSIVPQGRFTLNDILSNGELIMLTLTGPETYYDYHGKGMGLQYLLCEKFAQRLGVSLRVEVCKDTADLVRRLVRGDGDLIAFPLSRKTPGDLRFCGSTTDSDRTQWAVNRDNRELADSLNRWFRPSLVAETRKEEAFYLSTRSITRHVYSPMLDRSAGIISRYDRYFQMYAPMARVDWRLMAAQCYQESCFDPNARSWAGALGLMQIMPSTADHLGLPMSQVHDPESNIAAAAKFMAELGGHFGDIPDPGQRCYYVLASYNGGYRHVRDAMALASKYGRNPYNWGDVSEYILKLSMPQFYNDPVVKYGYMRGMETVDYVDRIRQRWGEYRGVARGGGGIGTFTPMTPRRARHRNRFRF